MDEASGRKPVRGLGREPAAPCVTAAVGEGWSVIQNETADGSSGGRGEHWGDRRPWLTLNKHRQAWCGGTGAAGEARGTVAGSALRWSGSASSQRMAHSAPSEPRRPRDHRAAADRRGARVCGLPETSCKCPERTCRLPGAEARERTLSRGRHTGAEGVTRSRVRWRQNG